MDYLRGQQIGTTLYQLFLYFLSSSSYATINRVLEFIFYTKDIKGVPEKRQ